MNNAGITLLDEGVLEAVKAQIARIEPIARAHQGGVKIVSATREEVVLGLKGHCAGCPLAAVTYGKILNKYILEACPQIQNIKYIELK